MQVREGPPNFCMAYPMPFAIKDTIVAELNQIKLKASSRVSYSEWAIPIVAVPKSDGMLRICGNFKVNINSIMDNDQYLLPKPDDLFAILAGGRKFSILDLSRPINSWMRTPGSTMVNIHSGL